MLYQFMVPLSAFWCPYKDKREQNAFARIIMTAFIHFDIACQGSLAVSVSVCIAIYHCFHEWKKIWHFACQSADWSLSLDSKTLPNNLPENTWICWVFSCRSSPWTLFCPQFRYGRSQSPLICSKIIQLWDLLGFFELKRDLRVPFFEFLSEKFD